MKIYRVNYPPIRFRVFKYLNSKKLVFAIGRWRLLVNGRL